MASDEYVKKSVLARPIGVDFIRQLNFSFDSSNDSSDDKVVADKSSVYIDKIQQLWLHYNLDAYPNDSDSVNGGGGNIGVGINNSLDLSAKDLEIMLNDLEYAARTLRSPVSFRKSFENYLRTGISYTSFIEILKKLVH